MQNVIKICNGQTGLLEEVWHVGYEATMLCDGRGQQIMLASPPCLQPDLYNMYNQREKIV